MLLPDLNLKCDSDIKIAFNIQSVAAPMEEPTVAEEGNEVILLPIPSSSIPTQMLDTMLITIRDVLKLILHHCSPQATTMQGVCIFKLSTTVNLAVNFIKHLREAKKRSLNRDLREYLVKQKATMPRKPPIGKNKVIDVLAPLSDVDHTLCNELHGLRSDAYTFLSYGYAVHVRKGVKASEETGVQSHQPQENEANSLLHTKS
ncbi:hypothetical protein EMCRGX_G004639 [Ephydatia muelleri]